MNALFSVLSACWLGLLTALSPCSLAASLIAVSYISGSSRTWRTVLCSAAAYAAGVACIYFLLALLASGAVHRLNQAYASVCLAETALRRATGLLFLIAGVYYTVTRLLQ